MQSADNITLNRLLTTVARQEASDLHLTIGAPPVIRKESMLYQMEQEEIVTANFLERVIESFIGEGERSRLDQDKEVALTHTFNKVMRFRIHIYKQKGYYSLSFRYLPTVTKKISDLALPQYLEQVVRYKEGLVIVTGSYDSGKSTTLAAIVNTVNELGPPRYINTIEMPVERLFANNKCIIEQREVGADVASYAQGLKLVLDGDIDMVIVDEVYDRASAMALLEVLEAGRLVVLTTGSSGTINALTKIMSFIDSPNLVWAYKVLATHLQCILMQKLLRRIGGGRVLVFEFLINAGLMPAVIGSSQLDRITTVLRSSRELGMISLEESLALRIKSGELKLEDALLEANDRAYLKTFLR